MESMPNGTRRISDKIGTVMPLWQYQAKNTRKLHDHMQRVDA